MRRPFLTPAVFVFLFATAWGMTAEEEDLLVSQMLSMSGRAPGGVGEPAVPHPRICGTATVMEAKRRFNELSPASQALLRPVLFARPNLPKFFDVPLLAGQGGPGFRIHYADTGPDSVRNASVDLRGFNSPVPNGVPDWVDTLGLILDSIWIREVNQLGFRAPLSDGFYAAGDGPRFDVYLVNLGGIFLGGTFPDSAGLGNPLFPSEPNNKSTAFITLHSTFDLFPYNVPPNSPQKGIRVTAAHEFFHAVQFAYNVFAFEVVAGNGLFYWQEATAVRMEEQVYGNIDDYHQYLPFWFRSPELSFRSFSLDFFGRDQDRAFHPYALGIYGIYLDKKFPGFPAVKRVWENLATVFTVSQSYSLFNAIDDALAAAGFMPGAAFPQRFLASLQEFYQWNYFVGPKSLNQFYGAESAAWPASFDLLRAVDSTEVYPTRSKNFPCTGCSEQALAFFHSTPCGRNLGPPCIIECDASVFTPYTRSAFCVQDVEDLGASYLNLQNPGEGSFVNFALKSDTTRPAPWFAAAAGYNRDTRSYTFLTGNATDRKGEIPEWNFGDFGLYTEVVIMATNETLVPVDSSRKRSTYAYFANVDSSAPPGATRIADVRPNPFRPARHGKAFFPVDLDSLSGSWTVSLIVFSPTGEIVFQDEQLLQGGQRIRKGIDWDGLNQTGEPAASGVYFCKLVMQELGRSRREERVLKLALIR